MASAEVDIEVTLEILSGDGRCPHCGRTRRQIETAGGDGYHWAYVCWDCFPEVTTTRKFQQYSEEMIRGWKRRESSGLASTVRAS